ncbi:EAL domain-containing protein [Shewanella pneumatophori]|uniref:EAL domain-containing protein n=1 Tax=Shewanella pneumatophori TaxID=314092 RepID=A0A9X2CIR7_9GAMM|nr:EAL domain-containing protein [Shewanella pneumatophori]MCL1139729.1 EAL domain-containing protein [Shewanella pneumatophori]
MLKFDHIARKKDLPWLIIATVLFCAVASYYLVHYTVFKTFSMKVVKFDNLYVEGLTKANHNLKTIQNELQGLQVKVCSAEVLQVFTDHILTSNEQDLVWVKYPSESVICSAIGTTQIYGPKYIRVGESSERGLYIYQQTNNNNSNALWPIYAARLSDNFELFVRVDAVQNMADILPYATLSNGLSVHLNNGSELLRLDDGEPDAETMSFYSATTDLRYCFSIDATAKNWLWLNYFLISMLASGLTLFFGYLMSGLAKQLYLNRNFRMALKRNEFFLAYQPIIDTNEDKVFGVEVLLRWRNTDGSIRNTGDFIGDLELSPVMQEITRWVMLTALNELTGLLKQQTIAWCSINISAKEIEQGQMHLFLLELAEQGYPVDYLSFELTERIPISDWNKLKQFIDVCQQLGCKIELDDVGTGYGGNLWLQNLDFDYLKIDQQFVSRLGEPGNRLSLVLSYMAIAEELNISVIAEGVETPEQAEILNSLGVYLHQGWLYSKALPVAGLQQYLQ